MKKPYVFDEYNNHWGPSRQRLKPVLFLVYINDIPQCSYFEPILNAEGAVMTLSDSKLNRLKKKVETEFAEILTWIDCNQLRLNLK